MDEIRFVPPSNNPLYETFFEYMDEVSAYVMGYIYAKGVIVNKNGHKAILIRNKKDIRTLYRIKEILGSKEEITKRGELYIISDALCDSLLSYGFDAGVSKDKKKTITKMPFLEPPLVRHFVRGFYDAVGYCTPEIQGRIEDSQRMITFLPFKNQEFIEDFKKFVSGSGGPLGSVHLYDDRPHLLKFYHRGSQALYWYMYKDAYIYSVSKKAQLEHGFGLIQQAKQRYWAEKNKKKSK